LNFQQRPVGLALERDRWKEMVEEAKPYLRAVEPREEEEELGFWYYNVSFSPLTHSCSFIDVVVVIIIIIIISVSSHWLTEIQNRLSRNIYYLIFIISESRIFTFKFGVRKTCMII
jgi:hypothetical protein